MADTAHELQARSEGVEIVGDRITFCGAEFRRADRVGLMPLMRFAMSAKSGLDSDDMEGLAALYTLIRDCIDTSRPQKPVLDEDGQPLIKDGQPVTEDDGPSEWDRFERHACDTKAEADDLMKVVQDVMVALTARPTQRPADSSAGPPTTSENSKAISPLRAVPAGADEMIPIQTLLDRSTG